jgi:alpha-tubulin suppressor-like RCC1 family protein
VPSSSDVFLAGAAITLIAVSSGHSCALTSAGGVRCFGTNYNGQCGYGSATSSGVLTPGADVDLGGGTESNHELQRQQRSTGTQRRRCSRAC